MLILDSEIILYVILFKSVIISEPHKTDFHFWFRIPIVFTEEQLHLVIE